MVFVEQPLALPGSAKMHLGQNLPPVFIQKVSFVVFEDEILWHMYFSFLSMRWDWVFPEEGFIPALIYSQSPGVDMQVLNILFSYGYLPNTAGIHWTYVNIVESSRVTHKFIFRIQGNKQHKPRKSSTLIVLNKKLVETCHWSGIWENKLKHLNKAVPTILVHCPFLVVGIYFVILCNSYLMYIFFTTKSGLLYSI